MPTPAQSDVEEALIACVRRHAELEAIELRDEVRPSHRPYPDLGLDSNDDLNFACEIEQILGVELPPEMTVLYEKEKGKSGRPLSIGEAAARICSVLQMLPR